MTCPDCSGTGKITLFTSAKPCKACGGTGKSDLIVMDLGPSSGTITMTSLYVSEATPPAGMNPAGYSHWMGKNGTWEWTKDHWEKLP
jgi:hypothetical protein